MTIANVCKAATNMWHVGANQASHDGAVQVGRIKGEPRRRQPAHVGRLSAHSTAASLPTPSAQGVPYFGAACLTHKIGDLQRVT